MRLNKNDTFYLLRNQQFPGKRWTQQSQMSDARKLKTEFFKIFGSKKDVSNVYSINEISL